MPIIPDGDAPKSVIILAHFFPPYRNVQSRLNLATALAFRDRGWDVTVVTSTPPGDLMDDSFKEVLEGFDVRRYAPRQFSKAIQVVRNKLRIPRDHVILTGERNSMQVVALKALCEIKPRLIYSISAPGDAHSVAAFLKKNTNAAWISEFQDPWLDNNTLLGWMDRFSLPAYSKLWQRRVENFLCFVIREADLIVTESAGHAEQLRHRAQRWGEEGKILHAYLGADQRLSGSAEASAAQHFIRSLAVPTLGFVGSIYPGYEDRARALIRALCVLERRGVPFLFLTVGCSVLPQMAVEEGLHCSMALYPVSYADALAYMAALDVGIVIPSSAININSKLFDYIMQGCRILVWGHPEGEMARLVVLKNCGEAADDKKHEASIVVIQNILRQERLGAPQSKWFTRKECLAPLWQAMEKKGM